MNLRYYDDYDIRDYREPAIQVYRVYKCDKCATEVEVHEKDIPPVVCTCGGDFFKHTEYFF